MSQPISFPLSWLGFPSNRTRTLFADGLPHKESCQWISLGPINIGLGRFQEIACFHRPSGALLVTDALIGIDKEPPEIFEVDPTPLLFHSRDRGDEPLLDSIENRRKGWARLVIFASFLKPSCLEIPPLREVFKYSFKPGLRNPKSHFGLFPFLWKEGWETSLGGLLGKEGPLIQVAPVLERLVFPRAKETLIEWLNDVEKLRNIRWLISSHYSAPIDLRKGDIRRLKNKILKGSWANNDGNFSFLGGLDKSLLSWGVVPKNPLNKNFRD